MLPLWTACGAGGESRPNFCVHVLRHTTGEHADENVRRQSLFRSAPFILVGDRACPSAVRGTRARGPLYPYCDFSDRRRMAARRDLMRNWVGVATAPSIIEQPGHQIAEAGWVGVAKVNHCVDSHVIADVR